MSANFVTEDTWSVIRTELRRVYPRDTFESWFAPLECEISGDTHTLIAPNDFAAIWIEENYLPAIRERFTQVLGGDVKVALRTRGSSGIEVAKVEPE
ncbi:MAG TPA: DnaA N-terminal domain-containing protein, partial [Opitutales bacterium]|nr:DnaA N-terminal domain-containing protein [Opitutales bacterium]